MKKCFFAIIIFHLCLIGCKKQIAPWNMDRIESLIEVEQYDSAYLLFSYVDEKMISTKEDIAHYYLLKTKINYIKTNTLSSDSLINLSISYFNPKKNPEKVADCYYYKGVSNYLKKNYEEAIVYYKKAEELSNASNNYFLNFKIAEALSLTNSLTGNYKLSLKHAQKALSESQKGNRKDWMVYALFRIGMAFYNLDKEDSAFYYFNKTKPYIKYVKENNRPVFLSNLGILYIDKEPKVAKYYLQQSLQFKELTATLEQLANISYEEGNHEEAYNLWKRALTINDLTPKDNIIHNLLEYDIEHGKTDKVCEQVNEIIAIKDSIINKVKNDTIRDLQMRFDHQVEMNAANVRLIHWQWALSMVIFLVLCLIGYIVWRKHKTKLLQIEYEMRITKFSHQILELEMEIAKAENNILELKSTDSHNQDEIKRLAQIKEMAQQEIGEMERKMEQWQGKEAGKIRRGIKLYDEVVQNKTVHVWTPSDYEAFIIFYEVGNFRFVKKMRKQYPGITQRNMLYLILIDMGKTKEEISHIMSLNKSSLRSVRHRLNHWKDID